MLEKIVIFLVVINIGIFVVNKLLSGAPNQNRRAYPTMPLDVSDFGAQNSYFAIREFENGGARFLYDLKLDELDGDVIEMVMLAKSGIYIFEHVPVNGWIYGMENSENWTKKLQMGSGRKPQEEKFPNPVPIIEKKLEALKKLVDNESVVIRGLVVFPEVCMLKNIKVFSTNVKVVTLDGLLFTTINLNNRIGTNLTQHEINELYDTLSQYEEEAELNEQI